MRTIYGAWERTPWMVRLLRWKPRFRRIVIPSGESPRWEYSRKGTP